MQATGLGNHTVARACRGVKAAWKRPRQAEVETGGRGAPRDGKIRCPCLGDHTVAADHAGVKTRAPAPDVPQIVPFDPIIAVGPFT